MDGDPAYPMTSVDESRMFSRSIPVLELLIVVPGWLLGYFVLRGFPASLVAPNSPTFYLISFLS